MKLNKNQEIYLDFQSTTPTDSSVLKAMLPYFSEQFGNPHSNGHAVGWKASATVDEAARKVAKMIGADAEEVIFTSGATEANNLAILGLAQKNQSGKRNKVFVGATEHKCVLASSRVMESGGRFEVHHIPVDKTGLVDLAWLEDKIDEHTLLVSVMAVNNEIGTFAPLDDISEICLNNGVILHTDAAQAPYAMDVSQLAEIADMVSISGHKMYGPKGVGALFVSNRTQSKLSPIIHGGGQQRNLRSGTVPVPLAVGLGIAASLHDSQSTQKFREAISQKRDHFWSLIQQVFPAAKLNGPSTQHRHPGNLNVQFPGHDARDLLLRLQPSVAASTGSACNSGIEEPSYVLSAIGLSENEANASLRFSIGKRSTMEELAIAAGHLECSLDSLKVIWK